MNELAILLNKEIDATPAWRLLSDYGKRFFFPSKGIVAQSAEAKAQAHRYDATIGMACLDKKPIALDQVKTFLTGLSEDEAFSYAPTPGLQPLRELWKKEIYRKNPELGNTELSLPVVVPGLTAGIAQLSELFLDKGDNIVVADMFWDNYSLIFETKQQANMVNYNFFNKEKTGLDLDAFKAGLLAGAKGKSIKTIMNFPNNPTGYSPTVDEANKMAEILLDLANEGYEILAITDDAYFGLFYEENTYKQSLFAKLANLHKNILAVKVDGTTKEHFSWGFRVGFVTFASKDFTSVQLNSLAQKLSGSCRASFSNSSKPAQSILLKAMADSTYEADRQKFDDELEARYHLVKKALAGRTTGKKLVELPYNSGYFMAFEYLGDSNALRQQLLAEEGIGTISLQGTLLRVAFSAVDQADIADLYERVLAAADRS